MTRQDATNETQSQAVNDQQLLVVLPGRGAEGRDTALSAPVRAPIWTAMEGMPAGIQYDPEFLASGETYLPKDEAANSGTLGFFTGLDLGLPGLGRLSRDPAAMPGMGGLAVVLLGILALSLWARRRPLPFRR